MNWGYMILNRVGFPLSVLPDITETKGVKPIAVIDSSIFGVAIPIGAIVWITYTHLIDYNYFYRQVINKQQHTAPVVGIVDR